MSRISVDSDDLDRVGLHAGDGGAPGPSHRAGVHRWRDLTDQQKRIVVVALVVHAVVAALTLRDLGRRPAEAVRGPKAVWRIWATLNTSGSLAYWLVGRRQPASVHTSTPDGARRPG